jgi:hypothetical protein
MIFAKLVLGPLHQPNGTLIVEVLTQCDDTPFGRFRVRDLKSGHMFDVFEPQLELKWWENPNKQIQNPS